MNLWNLKRTPRYLSFLLLTLISSWAHAFPVQLEVVGTVPLGNAPELVLIGTERAQKTTLSLKRGDGRKFSFRIGDLREGQTHRIRLDSRAGQHHYEGTLSAEVNGERTTSSVEFSTVVAAPLQLHVDRKSLDLKARRLVLTSSRPPTRIDVKVVGLDNTIISEETIQPTGSSTRTTVTWRDPLGQDLVRIELRVEDKDGFFSAVALTPWSVEIQHEEVLFETNSSKITPSETGKLRSSLTEIHSALMRFRQIRGVQLFIAGHTDSRGSPAHNAQLSRSRARAIAAWFAKNKLPFAISYEGFGESSPKIKTPDETDEPKNRRVDYILSVEPPPLKNRKHRWRRLN